MTALSYKKAWEIVTYNQATSWGSSFKCTRHTAAHLDWTKSWLPKGTSLRIIQPCYHTGYRPSAGTHDKDAVLDVQIEGMTYWGAQTFLRDHRWAAWYRYPPTFSPHIHMVSLGCNKSMTGVYVPGQITDYYHRALGLSGGHNPGSDPSYHPDPIRVFDAKKYIESGTHPTGSKDMPLNADDKAFILDAIDNRVDKLANAMRSQFDHAKQRDNALRKNVNDRVAGLRAAINHLPPEIRKDTVDALNSLDATIQLVVNQPSEGA